MKIKKVILHNYRAYKHEVFNFEDGLNVIVGVGDSGKSAILKGISFVTENNQAGNIVSDEIKDEKGKIMKGESCWVELHLDDSTIIRRERGRNSSDNFYRINDGDKIGAGTSVPEDVAKILNMNEVNIQSQFETHFMLNDNASTVAKTLNKMVNLEIIDESISNIGKIVRSIKKDKDASEVNLKKYKDKIEKFDFIEDMEMDVNEILDLESKMDKAIDKHDTLLDHLEAIQALTEELSTITDITTHETLVDVLVKLYASLGDKQDNHNMLLESLETIKIAETKLNDIDVIVKNEKIVNDLIALFDKKNKEDKSYNSLTDCIDRIEDYEKNLKSFTDLDKYSILVTDILGSYDSLNSLKDKKERLEDVLDNVNGYEKDIIFIEKEIEVGFAKIEGEACPVCGGEIKIEEVC